jgi:serine/threonine-protein kinase RsbW
MPRHRSGEKETVERLLESTLESVDAAEGLVLHAARQAGFSEDERQAIGMAVRECMVNAVVHGNQYSSRKKVLLSIATTKDRFIVRVADEGAGFNPDSLPDPLAAENLLKQSGRGIFLIRAFMDEFSVAPRFGAGSEATLVKYRGPK